MVYSKAMKTDGLSRCLEGVITVEDAARLGGYTQEGVRKAIREKRLRARMKGRFWLIYRSDFERFMKS